MRSSERRSRGRGTSVDNEKVVEANAASSPPLASVGLRRISEPNIDCASRFEDFAPKRESMDCTVKKAFHSFDVPLDTSHGVYGRETRGEVRA
jgi:hypothetical protein